MFSLPNSMVRLFSTTVLEKKDVVIVWNHKMLFFRTNSLYQHLD